jgi:hypothetical protein
MTSADGRSMRREWNALRERPFIKLIRLFVGRVFHGNSDSAEMELDLSMGLILSLLALPGGFYSIFLLEKYSTLLRWMRGQHELDPLAAALPDEYFFIVLSMVVTGVLAVWRWDHIFPDRRDYANLVHLPISTRAILVANLAAIAFLGLVLAIDVNAASALLFPLVVSASEETFGFFAHFVGIHAFVVVTASIFSFFAVFVTVGVLMVSLPYNAFRRISLYLRALIIASLVAVLSTSFAIPPMVRELPESWVRFLPPVWFLGLCQLIRGKATPALALEGWVALIGSAVVVVAAVMIYVLGYRRCFVRIPETAEVISASNRSQGSRIFAALDSTVLTSPFQRAGYRFAMKTLLRNERHSLVLGGFLGLGIVTASQFLFASFNVRAIDITGSPPAEILAIPLILSYCIILGVRFVLDIPAETRANWIFQLCLDKARHHCLPLARRIVLTFVLPWVFLIVPPTYGYLWGWRVGLLETVVVTLWSVWLAEILLLRFRKVPFTCSYPPFRESAVVVVLSYVLGFFVFVVFTSNLEHWALLSPALMVFFFAVPFGAWYVLSSIREDIPEIDRELIFEEVPSAGFELLDLERGT